MLGPSASYDSFYLFLSYIYIYNTYPDLCLCLVTCDIFIIAFIKYNYVAFNLMCVLIISGSESLHTESSPDSYQHLKGQKCLENIVFVVFGFVSSKADNMLPDICGLPRTPN